MCSVTITTKCIICNSWVTVTNKENLEKEFSKNFFEVFATYLRVKETFNFKLEPLPFCVLCRDRVVELYKIHRHLNQTVYSIISSILRVDCNNGVSRFQHSRKQKVQHKEKLKKGSTLTTTTPLETRNSDKNNSYNNNNNYCSSGSDKEDFFDCKETLDELDEIEMKSRHQTHQEKTVSNNSGSSNNKTKLNGEKLVENDSSKKVDRIRKSIRSEYIPDVVLTDVTKKRPMPRTRNSSSSGPSPIDGEGRVEKDSTSKKLLLDAPITTPNNCKDKNSSDSNVNATSTSQNSEATSTHPYPHRKHGKSESSSSADLILEVNSTGKRGKSLLKEEPQTIMETRRTRKRNSTSSSSSSSFSVQNNHHNHPTGSLFNDHGSGKSESRKNNKSNTNNNNNNNSDEVNKNNNKSDNAETTSNSRVSSNPDLKVSATDGEDEKMSKSDKVNGSVNKDDLDTGVVNNNEEYEGGSINNVNPKQTKKKKSCVGDPNLHQKINGWQSNPRDNDSSGSSSICSITELIEKPGTNTSNCMDDSSKANSSNNHNDNNIQNTKDSLAVENKVEVKVEEESVLPANIKSNNNSTIPHDTQQQQHNDAEMKEDEGVGSDGELDNTAKEPNLKDEHQDSTKDESFQDVEIVVHGNENYSFRDKFFEIIEHSLYRCVQCGRIEVEVEDILKHIQTQHISSDSNNELVPTKQPRKRKGEEIENKKIKRSALSRAGKREKWTYKKHPLGYKCGTCGIVKSRVEYITYHLWQRHSGRGAKNEESSLQDASSEDSFSQEQILDGPSNSSLSLACPFVCDEEGCGEAFESTSQLYEHKRKHRIDKIKTLEDSIIVKDQGQAASTKTKTAQNQQIKPETKGVAAKRTATATTTSSSSSTASPQPETDHPPVKSCKQEELQLEEQEPAFECTKCHRIFKYQKLLDKHTRESHHMQKPRQGRHVFPTMSIVRRRKSEVKAPASRVTPAMDGSDNNIDIKLEDGENASNSLNLEPPKKKRGPKKKLKPIHPVSNSSSSPTHRFKCSYKGCNRLFGLKANLQAHFRTHTGERPYICPYETCRKRFSQRGNLKTHLKIHTGDRPFKCPHPQCNRTFIQRANLRSHLQTGNHGHATRGRKRKVL